MEHSTHKLDLVPSASAVYELRAGTTVRDIAAVLFRRKRILLFLSGPIFAGTLLGATWLRPYLFPPRYVSGLKFILKKDRFDAVVTPADRAVPGLTTTVSAQEIHSEVELLKSADVMDPLARHARVPLERLNRDLMAEPVVAGRNITNLIAVRYSAPDPAEVTRVLEKLPDLYLEKHLAINRRPVALEYFRSQAEAYEQQLQQAEEELVDFENQQPALGTEDQQRQAHQKLAAIENQKFETEAAIHDAQSRNTELAKQMEALPATIPAIRRAEESACLQRLKNQLLELGNQRSKATFYREIEQLDRRIREVRQAIAGEAQPAQIEESVPNPLHAAVKGELLRSQAALAGLRARIASLAGQETVCREELAAARSIVVENAGLKAELLRNMKAAEESHSLYRKKYAEAHEAEDLDRKRILNVALAEAPRAPSRAGGRGLWFYLAFGFLLAAAAGTTAACAAEALDHSIHTPRQLENCSSVVVLASIPASRVR